MTLAVLSAIIALGAAFVAGPAPFVLLFIISLSGVLYNARLLPAEWRFQSLKDIPAAYTAEKDADKKAMLQKASATQCKDATAKLHELMAKAGC